MVKRQIHSLRYCGRLQKWHTNSLHFSIYGPLQCDFTAPSIKKWNQFLCSLKSELGRVTCFGQWSISKCDRSLDLKNSSTSKKKKKRKKNSSTSELVLSCYSWEPWNYHIWTSLGECADLCPNYPCLSSRMISSQLSDMSMRPY